MRASNENGMMEALRDLIARDEASERILAALSALLARNNVFAIVFKVDLKVVSHNLPLDGELASLLDFRPYLGDALTAQIREALSRAPSASGELLADCRSERGLRCSLHRAEGEPPIFVLQLEPPSQERISSAEPEEIWDQTSDRLADVQRLLAALDGIRRLDPKISNESLRREIREERLPALRELRARVADPVLALCLELIENNLSDIVVSGSSGMPDSIYARLTPSEIQIADFIKMGKSTKDIADALSIATKTVENHRNNLREKLGLRNLGVNLRSYLMRLEKGGDTEQ
jgi:DNA-binding CsgD family transcriptional regulator